MNWEEMEVVYEMGGNEMFCTYKSHLKNQLNLRVLKFSLLLKICVIYEVPRFDEFFTIKLILGSVSFINFLSGIIKEKMSSFPKVVYYC